MLNTMIENASLQQLGWSHFFQQQLSLEEYERCQPARLFDQSRSFLYLLGEGGEIVLPMSESIDPVTVGDWVLLNDSGRYLRRLERISVFARKAPGTRANEQLIAANVDTVFIVTSMNLDFNLNRLERYLALAHEADTLPVIVLTKPDTCDEPEHYHARAKSLGEMIDVVTVNGLEAASVEQLLAWCQPGKTIAFLGSSGVGKSTLVNTLSGRSLQATRPVRPDDDKGRHTTTSRSLIALQSGALLLDTPGMRELQLADCESGIEDTFSEITGAAAQCRFTDCQHEQEPGCAVRAALEAGEISPRRFASFQKLMKEQAFNTATLAEKRARERAFGKHVRKALKAKLGQQE